MSLLDFLKRKKETKEKKPSFAKATEGKEKKVTKEAKETKDIKEKEIAKEVEEVKKPSSALATEGQRPSFTKASKGKGRKKKKADKKLNSFIIQAPHITEKATDLQTKDQYTFRVSLDSNKTEIKKTIEQLYNVDVLSVKIIKVPRKRRRVGKVSGWRKGYKKAIIRVGKGQKIEELTI